MLPRRANTRNVSIFKLITNCLTCLSTQHNPTKSYNCVLNVMLLHYSKHNYYRRCTRLWRQYVNSILFASPIKEKNINAVSSRYFLVNVHTKNKQSHLVFNSVCGQYIYKPNQKTNVYAILFDNTSHRTYPCWLNHTEFLSIHILGPPSLPDVTPIGLAGDNDSTTIWCKVSSLNYQDRNLYHWKWEFNGNDIKENGKYNTSYSIAPPNVCAQSIGWMSLRITNFSSQDFGQYKCALLSSNITLEENDINLWGKCKTYLVCKKK